MARQPRAPKVPKTLGECADRLYEIKQLKSDLNKQMEALDSERKMIQEKVIEQLPKSNATGVTGRTARVAVVTQDMPIVENWDDFYAYVAKTKSFDLLQRRLSEKAVEVRAAEGEKVPGVGSHTIVKVSLSKA